MLLILSRFLIDDVEDEWLNGDDFDFVRLRNMIPILKSPVLLLKQAYACVPHLTSTSRSFF